VTNTGQPISLDESVKSDSGAISTGYPNLSTIRIKALGERKKASEFACLNWLERTKNYAKGAPTNAPANLSTSIRCSGPNPCAARVKALITASRYTRQS